MSDIPDGAIKALTLDDVLKIIPDLSDVHRSAVEDAVVNGFVIWLYKTTDADGFPVMNLSIAPGD